MENYSHR